MTQQKFDIYVVKVEEIVDHLVEHHSVPFGDRASLHEDDFMFEHFPELLKDLEDKNLEYGGKRGGYLSEEGRERVRKVRGLLRKALKFCEANSIAIAKVLDEDNGKWEWRVCKPTQEQLAFMKYTRWFASAEGYFNKAVSQEGMLEELSEGFSPSLRWGRPK